jgi:hypothetical protein
MYLWSRNQVSGMLQRGDSPVDSTVKLAETDDRKNLTVKGESLTGQVFVDKYEVLEELGQGGMGAVYRVRHIHLNRFAALKLLHTQHATNDGLLRFQQEAQVVSALKHPNIVGVTDFGIASDGQPYMVMDLLSGVPLSVFVKRESITAERLAKIFGQVCDALAYAHERSIVHRDIKPGNIMIHTENDVDEVMVVDFGIAKILPQEDSHKMHLTRTGELFGTPLYMSPEQCQGHRVDSRADIYALGCVMYEALAGLHPFATDNVFELFRRQINDTPPPLPKKGKNASDRLFEAIVLRAMAKSPADRYKYAVEMASDLKMLDSADKGLLSEMQVMVKVTKGRVKAGSKATAWWGASAQIASVMALVTAILLFVIPAKLNYEADQMNHNYEVLSTLLDSVSEIDEQGMAAPSPQRLRRKMKRLKAYMNKDPAQQRAYRELMTALPAAEKALYEGRAAVERGLAEQDMETLLTKVRPMMDSVIHCWTNVGRAFALLQSITYNKCKAHCDLVGHYLLAYSCCKWFGVFLLAGLSLLLGIRLQLLIEKRNAAKTPVLVDKTVLTTQVER